MLLGDFRQRIRDIVEGPDGNLYVATEGQSGGTAPDGMVLKIESLSVVSTSAAASAGSAITVAPRSMLYRRSVMNVTSGPATSSRRAWLEEMYAMIASVTIPM